MYRTISIAALALLGCGLQASMAAPAEIKLVSPGAVASSLKELIPQFEQSSGHKVTVVYSPALALADRIARGERADVAFLGGPAADELQKLGRLVEGS
jgi:molybdate transport system substrate-binding protein